MSRWVDERMDRDSIAQSSPAPEASNLLVRLVQIGQLSIYFVVSIYSVLILELAEAR